MGKLIIDGKNVYEIDEDCAKKNHISLDPNKIKSTRQDKEKNAREKNRKDLGTFYG